MLATGYCHDNFDTMKFAHESSRLAYDMLMKSNLESLNREITSNPTIINSLINEGETLLMAACMQKNKTAVRMLLTLGADPNIKCPSHNGETPIYKTCSLPSPNNMAIAKMLIDNGARLDIKTDNEKYSPLHQACFCGRAAVATLLIENGANCNAMNQYNETPLHIALRYEHVSKDIALLMVKMGGDLYTPLDIRGRRPIDYLTHAEAAAFRDAAPPNLTKRHGGNGSSKTPSKPPMMAMAAQNSRPRSSSITSTPEKKQSSGRTPPVSAPPSDNIMDTIAVRSFSRSILYKTNGQSTPMKQSPVMQSPVKGPSPASHPLQQQHEQQLHSPLVFTASQSPHSGVESSPARPQSPPPSTSYLECPRTPTRERTPVKTPIVESFASPPRASLLQSSSSGRVSSQHRTPSRQPPPPPPNTPSITQFFAAVAGKAVPKDLAMPVRSAQSVTTGHKRKSSALSDTDKAFCLKKTQKGGKGRSKRMLSSAEDSVDEEWEGNPEESTSTSTSRNLRKANSSSYRKRSSVDSESSENSESEEDAGYTELSAGSLPSAALQYLPYIGKRFLDTEDHVVFLVHSICTHPDYDGFMFKYYVVSSSSTATATPPTEDDDFEYTMCEEMTMEGSWAQWLTEDKDGDTRDDE